MKVRDIKEQLLQAFEQGRKELQVVVQEAQDRVEAKLSELETRFGMPRESILDGLDWGVWPTTRRSRKARSEATETTPTSANGSKKHRKKRGRKARQPVKVVGGLSMKDLTPLVVQAVDQLAEGGTPFAVKPVIEALQQAKHHFEPSLVYLILSKRLSGLEADRSQKPMRYRKVGPVTALGKQEPSAPAVVTSTKRKTLQELSGKGVEAVLQASKGGLTIKELRPALKEAGIRVDRHKGDQRLSVMLSYLKREKRIDNKNGKYVKL